MKEEAEKLTEDILFLACTRPALVAGVTMEAMGLNMMGSMFIYIASQKFTTLIIPLMVHFLMRELVKHDHNRFRVLMAWINTRGRALNSSYWGGSSISPLKQFRDYKEIL